MTDGYQKARNMSKNTWVNINKPQIHKTNNI